MSIHPYRIAQSGLTLIELLVTLAVLGVLLTVGIPAYFNFLGSNRMAAEMNDFVGSLHLARSEAIKQGANATICAADPATTPPTATNPHCLGAGNDWSKGWVVYVGAPAPARVLRVHAALQGGDALVASVGSNITFNRMGFTTQAQTLTLNDTHNTLASRQCVILNMAGRMRLARASDCP